MLASLCQGEARQRQILDLLCRYVSVGLCVHTSALELEAPWCDWCLCRCLGYFGWPTLMLHYTETAAVVEFLAPNL